MSDVTYAAIHKFHKAGGCYKIEYLKYKKFKGHKAFAISRYYERGRRWSQACGWSYGFATEKEAIERALAECRIGAKKEGGKEQVMKIPKPNCQVYHSQ